MDIKNPKYAWLESLFDPSDPYLYVLVLPALALFALGFRTQALIFALGAVGLLALSSMR